MRAVSFTPFRSDPGGKAAIRIRALFPSLAQLASLALFALLASACADAEPRATGYEISDSAGVRIVHNSAPTWGEREAWHLGETPDVNIGVVEGAPEYQLYRVRGALRLTDGRIVVANGGTNELRFYDERGRFLHSSGGEGDGPGEYRQMVGVHALAADSLLVYDLRAQRVSILDGSGGFVRSTPVQAIEEGAFPPWLLGVFGDGTMLARVGRMAPPGEDPSGARRDSDSYIRIGTDGTILNTLGVLPGMDRYTVVSDGANRRMVAAVNLPLGRIPTARAHADRFVFGSADGYEIAFRSPEGELRRLVRRELPPRSVTPALIRVARERMLEDAVGDEWRRRTEEMFADASLPSVLPAYAGFVLDAEGNLWVEEYRAPGEDAEAVWTVFDREGRMLGDVRLPGGFIIAQAGDDFVLGRRTDDFDVEYVELYSLQKP